MQIELNDLKRVKNTPMTQQPSTPFEQQQFQMPSQPHYPNVFNSMVLQQQQASFPLQQDTYTLSSPSQTESELKLKSKLSSKKEKIKQLKSELSSVKSENEALKAQINELNNRTKKENILLTNYNTNNSLVDELQAKVNLLEIENEAKTKKIQQLETIKNEELSLMNQKIKDFEVVIDENSANYVKDIAQYKTQIDNYKIKLLHYEKYVDVVNFFISKVNLMLQLNITSLNNNDNVTDANGIYDINELQNVLIQIETFINETIHTNNSNTNNYNMNIQPSFQNANAHIDNQEQEEIAPNHVSNDNNNVNNNSCQNDELFYKTLEDISINCLNIMLSVTSERKIGRQR